jgi:hypothetical protein
MRSEGLQVKEKVTKKNNNKEEEEGAEPSLQ